jgi:hypothetical protein
LRKQRRQRNSWPATPPRWRTAHPGHFERPNRSIDGRSTAVRDCRDSLVARESPPVLAVVEGVQQRPQDIHKGAGMGPVCCPSCFIRALYALTYTTMRASALRSRGTPGASPKTFSRRGAQQQARSENDTSLLHRVAQTRPEEAGTGVSPPVARILLPSGLILGQLGAATHPSFPTEVGLPPAVPPAGFACLEGLCLRLDRRPGRHHRRRESRVPSVRFDPLEGIEYRQPLPRAAPVRDSRHRCIDLTEYGTLPRRGRLPRVYYLTKYGAELPKPGGWIRRALEARRFSSIHDCRCELCYPSGSLALAGPISL